ncbi:unnamed protein product, partial [Lampetra planeri]
VPPSAPLCRVVLFDHTSPRWSLRDGDGGRRGVNMSGERGEPATTVTAAPIHPPHNTGCPMTPPPITLEIL